MHIIGLVAALVAADQRPIGIAVREGRGLAVTSHRSVVRAAGRGRRFHRLEHLEQAARRVNASGRRPGTSGPDKVPRPRRGRADAASRRKGARRGRATPRSTARAACHRGSALPCSDAPASSAWAKRCRTLSGAILSMPEADCSGHGSVPEPGRIASVCALGVRRLM